MKSILLFFLLLAISGCLAEISVLPLGDVVRCPYSKEQFLQHVILGGLEDYITKNRMATTACVKEIEVDYKEAVDIFVANMTDLTNHFEEKYSSNGDSSKNYPYFVSKAVKEMGASAQRYVQHLTSASDSGRIENVNHYDKALKEEVGKEYELYQKNLKYLESKGSNSDGMQNLIHKKCSDGMRMLVGVGKKFEECMQKRLTETEEYEKTKQS